MTGVVGLLALIVVWSGPTALAMALGPRLLPDVAPLERALAVGVLALALQLVTAQALGTLGLLSIGPLLAVSVLDGLLAWRWRPRGAAGSGSWTIPVPLLAEVPAVIAVVAVAAAGVTVNLVTLKLGIRVYDAVHYHLPWIAEFVQSGSTTAYRWMGSQTIWSYHPLNTELLMATVLVPMRVDWLVGLLNDVVLVGTVVGLLVLFDEYPRTIRLGVTALAVTWVGMFPMLYLNAGSAGSDALALGGVVAGAAFLRGRTRLTTGRLVLAGLAFGLSLGSKSYTLVPIALAAALPLVDRSEHRLRSLAITAAASLPTGAYWYARNLVLAGHPLPYAGIDLGPLRAERSPAIELLDFSVLHDLLSGAETRNQILRAWATMHRPGLVALAAVTAGLAVLGFVRGGTRRRLAAVALLVCVALYAATPTTAFGRSPNVIGSGLRYTLPALVFLGPLAGALPRRGWVAVSTGCALIAGWRLRGGLIASYGAATQKAFVVTCVVALLVLVLALARPRLPAISRRVTIAATGVGAVCLAAGVVATVGRYEQRRYASTPGDASIQPFLDRMQALAPTGATIGIVGLQPSYALAGPRLDHRVVYLGVSEPARGRTDIGDCPAFLRAVDRSGVALVVVDDLSLVSETLAAAAKPSRQPAKGWLRDAGYVEVGRQSTITAFRIDHSPRRSTCDGNQGGARPPRQ